jgi:hypothetical protein
VNGTSSRTIACRRAVPSPIGSGRRRSSAWAATTSSIAHTRSPSDTISASRLPESGRKVTRSSIPSAIDDETTS